MCAKPQLENGHTQIANEILEHLVKIHLSPNQWQVVLCIIRKTYGFHKKVDHIANFQIVEATGLCKAVVSRSLQNLESMNIITRNGKHIGFEKDWERWRKLAEPSTVSNSANSRRRVSSLANNEKLAVLSTELAISSTKVSNSVIPFPPLTTPPTPRQKIKETIQKKEYGEFQNVLLTDEEYQKLKNKFGADISEKIEYFSSALESKGLKYLSHYATILNWARRDEQKGGQNGAHRGAAKGTRLPTKYTEPPYDPRIEAFREAAKRNSEEPERQP